MIRIPIIFVVWLFAFMFYACEGSDEQSSNTSSSSDAKKNKKTTSYNLLEPDVSLEIDYKLLEMSLAPMEYVAWINDNEVNSLTKTKEIGEVNFRMKYLPSEYMICNDLRKYSVTQSELDSLILQYEGMEYFELRISIDDFFDEIAKYNVSNMSEYQQRIAYMSFAMQTDLEVFVGNDKKVPCQLFHFERTYGVAPYASFLFGFSKTAMGNNIKERTVVFNDNLFNKGLVKFYWHSAELENVPKIEVI